MQLAWREQRLGRDGDAARRIAPQHALLLDQPAGETTDHGLDPGTVANAVAICLKLREISRQSSLSQLLRLKGATIPRPLSDPSGYLSKDPLVWVWPHDWLRIRTKYVIACS